MSSKLNFFNLERLAGNILLMVMAIFLYIPMAEATPTTIVKWSSDKERKSLDLEVTGSDPLFKQCLDSGLTLQYRFEFQLCKRRRFWFNSCSRVHKQIHELKYNPVTGIYTLKKDRLRDKHNPAIQNLHEKSLAATRMRKVYKLKLDSILEPSGTFNSKRNYLSLRVMSDCKGNSKDIAAGISRILSLGMIKVAGFDTGTVDFYLNE